MIEEWDIIANIRLLRLEKGWTQIDLARASGINEKRYNRIEKKQRGLKVVELQKLTKALGVSVEYVMTSKLTISGSQQEENNA